MQTARLNIDQSQVSLLQFLAKEAHQLLVGIRTVLINIIARVATHQTFHHYLAGIIAGRNRRNIKRKFGYGVCTAGATYKDLTFVFRVEIDQIISTHKVGFHTNSATQTGFLIAREHTFNRSVLNVVALKRSHLHCYADTVISSERGTFSLEPFAINIGLNGVFLEVELNVGILLTHHIHMALQNNRRTIFIAFRCRLFNYDVARLICLIFQA